MCSLEKRGNIYILTLTGNDQHRLNPTLIDAIRSALSTIRTETLSSSSSPSGALVTTAEGNFFSNGFDLEWAARNSDSPSGAREKLGHMVSLFSAIVADLVSLPIPTVAAVTGHAAAAGFMLALCHDYIAMRSDRGVLYMSELDIGLPFPEYFTEIMRAKIGGDRRVLRDVMLRAAKLKAKEAEQRGIVDLVKGNAEDTMKAAVGLAEELAARNWNGNVYSEIRMGMFPELCRVVGLLGEEEEEKKEGSKRKTVNAISKL